MVKLSVKAYAKVNMALEIQGVLPDGYHQISTVLRGISLYDTVTLIKSERGIDLSCQAPLAWNIPVDQRNLAWQAAEILQQAFPQKVGGVAIKLEKNIPPAAGLGGGSADGGAVLLGLNELYKIGLSIEELGVFAARIGADVNFSLNPLTALGTHKGEILQDLPPGPRFWLVLLKPPFGLSTPTVYQAWDRLYLSVADGLIKKKPQKDLVRLEELFSVSAENNGELIFSQMFNDLTEGALTLQPQLGSYRQVMKTVLEQTKEQDGTVLFPDKSRKLILCGSGPTWACFFTSKQKAEKYRQALVKIWQDIEAGQICDDDGNFLAGPEIFLAHTLAPEDLELRWQINK